MFKAIRIQIERWAASPIVRGRVLGILGAGLLIFASQGSALAQTQAGDPTAALAEMAKGLINFIVALTAILMAVGIGTNFLTGMVETMAGRPGGLSSTWMRIAGIVMCFVGAVLTITISNAIIDALKSYKSTDGINLP